jgi:hypothetical protein
MRRYKRVVQISVLPTIHLGLCALVALLAPNSWWWFWISALDLPATLVLGYLNSLWHFTDKSLLVFVSSLTIFGTLWWLCIGVALSYFFEWFVRKIGMKKQQRSPENQAPTL